MNEPTEPKPEEAREEPAPPPPVKKRKTLRILAWSGGGLLLVVLLALLILPSIISSKIHSALTAKLEEKLDATVTIGDVSFGWGGGVSVESIRIVDRQGRSALESGRVEGSVAVFAAMGGEYRLDLTIHEPVVTLRYENGEWNLKSMYRKSEDDGGPLPLVTGSIRANQLRVILVQEDGDIDLADGELNWTIPSLEKPMPFTLGFPAGLRAEGTYSMHPDTEVQAEIHLENLALAKIPEMDGKASGRLTFHYGKTTSLKGQVHGTDVKAMDMDLPSVNARVEWVRGGKTDFDARIGDALHATMKDSKWTLSSDLAGLSRTAPSLLRLKKGFRLEGIVSGSGEIGSAFKADLEVRGLKAFDDKGKELPAWSRILIDMDGDLGSEKGEIRSCKIRAGRMAIEARGAYEKTKDGYAVRGGELDVLLDLDEIYRKAGSFLDLGDMVFGGSLEWNLTAEGKDLIETRSNLTSRSLRWGVKGQEDKYFGPRNVTGFHEATLDLRRDGQSSLRRLRLKAEIFEINASGNITNILEDARQGRFNYNLVIHTSKVTGVLGSILKGEEVDRADLVAAGLMNIEGGVTSIVGTIRSDDLLVKPFGLKKFVGDLNLTLGEEMTIVADVKAAEVRWQEEKKVKTFSGIDLSADLVWSEGIRGKIHAECSGLVLDGNGRLNRKDADYRLTIKGGIEGIIRSLDIQDYSATGLLDVDLKMKGPSVTGSVKVRDLEIGDDLKAADFVLSPDVQIDFKEETTDFTIREFKVVSGFLKGSARGKWGGDLAGRFDYQPDGLGAVVGPWLPGKLKGEGWKSGTFSMITLATEVGIWEVWGLSVSGLADYKDGDFELKLAINEGVANIKGRVEGEEIRARVDAKGLKAKTGTGQLLSRIHPLFDLGVAGEAGGTFDIELQGRWKGEAEGKGSFAGTRLRVGSSPIVAEILSLLGRKTERVGDVPRFPFTIEKDRIRYKDMRIRLGKHDIITSGWVGFDGKYDLTVGLPITDTLVSRHKLLSVLKGEYIRIPVRNSEGGFSFDLAGAVKNLLDDLLKNPFKKFKNPFGDD